MLNGLHRFCDLKYKVIYKFNFERNLIKPLFEESSGTDYKYFGPTQVRIEI